jgi:hypothetical protein
MSNISNISITAVEQGTAVNANAFSYADVCHHPVVVTDESKPGEKAKKPVTLASVLHRTRKIANVAVEWDAKHQISSTTMATASSVTSLGKVVGGGETFGAWSCGECSNDDDDGDSDQYCYGIIDDGCGLDHLLWEHDMRGIGGDDAK